MRIGFFGTSSQRLIIVMDSRSAPTRAKRRQGTPNLSKTEESPIVISTGGERGTAMIVFLVKVRERKNYTGDLLEPSFVRHVTLMFSFADVDPVRCNPL